MPISQAEIDFGKAAIARRLATQEQVRECVAIQQRMPQPLHLGAILVKKGYLSERDARELMAQVERGGANGSSNGGVHPSSHGSAATAPRPSQQGVAVAAPPSPYPGALSATCSACGARFPVPANQAGQRFRCRACGATVVAPPATPGYGAGGVDASAFARAGSDPSGRIPPGPVPGGNGSAFVRPAGNGMGNGPGFGTNPDSSGMVRGGGMHGTQVVPPSQMGPGVRAGQQLPVPPLHGGLDGADSGVAETKGAVDLGSKPGGVASNLAADDPIAHVMEARVGADGNVETVFGPYDILGEIARGGMGIVYRARQRDLKRIVALKVMKEGEGASKKQIKRFQRETETAAKLQHPNIVAVHEVGCHQGFHYFTMDLIEGEALDQLVKRHEKMPHNRVLQIVEETSRAIHYAHGKGIIHRDMKPANVLLDTDGHPKVTDFGLAKSIDHKSMLTRTGAVVGTPFYMPPEQARGDNDIDQRADVYAIGVILYELLTLKLPFHGETTMEVYRKILEEEPLPPRHHDPTIAIDVETIVMKAMDRDPGRRYQTAKDLADDVQRYLQGEPIAARPLNLFQKLWRKARKNMPVVIVGSITIVAMLGSGGIILWRWKKGEEDRLRIQKQHEWDTFTTELENLKINVKSQINSAVARMKDHDPGGALADLREGVRLLDESPRLSQDFKFNDKAEADAYFLKQKPDVAAIYRDAWRETGNAYKMRDTQEAFEDALQAYAKALEYDPSSKESLDVHLAIADVLAKKGDYQKSLDVLGSILEKDPNHVKALLARGGVHDRRGEHRKAIEDYTRIIDKELDSNDAHLRRGESLFYLHQYDEAKRDFEYVIERRENDFYAFVWRGRVKQALGDYSAASDDLTEAIDQQPSFPEGYYYRAELYFAQRKHAEAIKDYEVAITRSAQFYKAYVGLGRVLEWTLDYERAAQQYDEVLKGEDREAEQERPRALAAKAHLLALRADRLEVIAESELKIREEKADKNGPLAPPPPLAELVKRADEERTKREKQARDLYDQALKLSPRLVVALVGRARLSLAQGDVKAARADLEAAEAALAERPWVKESGSSSGHDPALAEVHSLVGHAALLAARQGNGSGAEFSEAIRRFEAALVSDKENAMATAGLGIAHWLKGTREQKPELLAKAQEWFKKARVLEGAGDHTADVESGKALSEEAFFQQEGVKHAQNADRSKKPEYYVQARQSFARAISQDPYHALAYLERAKLASLWKAWDLAIEDATSAIDADPFLRDAFEVRGFLLGQFLPEKRDEATQRPKALRDRAKALEDFAKAVLVAKQGAADANAAAVDAAQARFGSALARTALYPPPSNPLEAVSEKGTPIPPAAGGGDAEAFAQALADVSEAIATIPKDLLRWMDDEKTSTDRIQAAGDWYRLQARILEAMGKPDDAKAAIARADNVRDQAREAAKKAHELGKALRDRRNYSDAIAKFDRAIALDPELSDAFYDRGTCYLKIGNFVPGILDFSRALELQPRYADQFYNKVYQVSYVVDLNRVITELNKIVADHPDVSYVIFLRGFFYVAKTEFKKYDKQDLDAGIRDFDHALKLNPKHVSAMIYRGFLFFKNAQIAQGAERTKLFETSLANYKLAIENDPASGIAHFLTSMCWSVLSTEPEIDADEKKRRLDRSVEELRISIEDKGFKGFDRIKNDKGFDGIRNDPRVVKLTSGK